MLDLLKALMVNGVSDYSVNYAEIYDIVTSHKDYSIETETLVSNLVRYNNSKYILSIGCGTGSHECFLSKKGYKVFGIDRSPQMIKKAQEKSIDGYCEFGTDIQCAISFFASHKPRIILSLFNVINCLPNQKSLASFFSEILSYLGKNGVFCFESWNGTECKINPPRYVSREFESKKYSIVRNAIPKIFSAQNKLEIEYLISGNLKGENINIKSLHEIQLFSPFIILDSLKSAGFKSIDVFTALPELKPLNINNSEGKRMLAFIAKNY